MINIKENEVQQDLQKPFWNPNRHQHISLVLYVFFLGEKYSVALKSRKPGLVKQPG